MKVVLSILALLRLTAAAAVEVSLMSLARRAEPAVRNDESLLHTFRTISAIFIVLGSIALLGFSTGKVAQVSKPMVLMLGGASYFGVMTFVACRLFLDLSPMIVVACVVVVTIAAAFAVHKGQSIVGDFGMGGLMGYVLAIILAQFVQPLLTSESIRFAYLLVISVAVGALVAWGKSNTWTMIAGLFVGSFGLVHGLDYLFLGSNFSNMAVVAFEGGSFSFDTNTSIAFCVFMIIFIGTVFLQRAKIFK